MEAVRQTVWLERVPSADKALVKVGGIVAAAAVTALCAQVSVPWLPVPFTLQTLAVLATGLALGSRLGAASMAAYVATGICGAPVFAEFKAGPAVLLGPTGGYLLGFIAAAWLMGWAAEKGHDRKVWSLMGFVALAHLAIYVPGSLWLSVVTSMGLDKAVAVGVIPFLAGDAVKAIAASLAVPAAWRVFPEK